jgi:hypothetical protein
MDGFPKAVAMAVSRQAVCHRTHAPIDVPGMPFAA